MISLCKYKGNESNKMQQETARTYSYVTLNRHPLNSLKFLKTINPINQKEELWLNSTVEHFNSFLGKNNLFVQKNSLYTNLQSQSSKTRNVLAEIERRRVSNRRSASEFLNEFLHFSFQSRPKDHKCKEFCFC